MYCFIDNILLLLNSNLEKESHEWPFVVLQIHVWNWRSQLCIIIIIKYCNYILEKDYLKSCVVYVLLLLIQCFEKAIPSNFNFYGESKFHVFENAPVLFIPSLKSCGAGTFAGKNRKCWKLLFATLCLLFPIPLAIFSPKMIIKRD